MADRKLGCLTIFLFVALCASVFMNFILAMAAFRGFAATGARVEEPLPRFREIVIERGARMPPDRIALITMRGLISSSIPGSVSDSMVEDMRLALQQARDDNRVKAIVLEIDSPGGEVTAADQIYNAVTKARARKPVVIYMDSLAASGGYYIACGGKFLMANETTITGSIGVIIQTLNYEQLFNKIADGRILSGKEALNDKLIDGLGQIEDAFAKAKQLGNAPQATVVKYGPPFSLARFFRAFGQTGQSKIELQLPKQLVPQLESGRAYFLPSFYAP